MKDTAIDLFFAIICAWLSYAFWNYAAHTALRLFGVSGDHGLLVLLAILAINAADFSHGLFHTPDDIGAVAPDRVGLMQEPYDSDRVWILVIAFLTIGLSQYTRSAVTAWQSSRRSPN